MPHTGEYPLISSDVLQWTLGKLRQNAWRKMPTELRGCFSEVLVHAMAGLKTGQGPLSPRLEEGVCKLVYALAAQAEGAGTIIIAATAALHLLCAPGDLETTSRKQPCAFSCLLWYG